MNAQRRAVAAALPWIGAAVGSTFVAGCATPPPAAGAARRPMWPVPPEQPRYAFEATLRNAASLQDGAQSSALRRLIVGDEELRASFGKPMGVAAARGRVYVTDTEGRRIFVFDVPRRRTFSFGLRLQGQLKKPSGIALDGEGRVYVVDTSARRVVIYDELGLYLGDIDGAAHWVRPSAVAVSGDARHVCVVDTGGVDSASHRVCIHDRDGRLVGSIGKRGHEPGELNLPADAAIGPDGLLWVLDAGNFRVQAFDADGRVQRIFGSAGSGLGQLARPRGLAVGHDGIVFVADALLCNVQVFDAQGQLLLALGSRAQAQDAPGRYLLPARLACDASGRLYVVDQYLHKIEVLRRVGEAEGRALAAAAPR